MSPDSDRISSTLLRRRRFPALPRRRQILRHLARIMRNSPPPFASVSLPGSFFIILFAGHINEAKRRGLRSASRVAANLSHRFLLLAFGGFLFRLVLQRLTFRRIQVQRFRQHS